MTDLESLSVEAAEASQAAELEMKLHELRLQEIRGIRTSLNMAAQLLLEGKDVTKIIERSKEKLKKWKEDPNYLGNHKNAYSLKT